MRPLCQIFSVAVIMLHYISRRVISPARERLVRHGDRGFCEPESADEAVEFAGDRGQVLLGACDVIRAPRWRRWRDEFVCGGRGGCFR